MPAPAHRQKIILPSSPRQNELDPAHHSITVANSLAPYFSSGWAFLIPYLATYLLYAWLKWPVNPEGTVKVIGEAVESLSAQPVFHHRPPCLLHVYWFLHGLHLILGAIALRTLWRHPTLSIVNSKNQASLSHPPVAWQRLYAILPWLCLALIFWIPGVYLEFPADPWLHYGRVNEWSWLQVATDHSSWNKSSYFLAYSLIGWISPPSFQLKWFDLYYACCCLMLCWQYYRLAHAVGLGARASTTFVLLQALLSGNYMFGFFRYYGMSSSLFAQLGAVAVLRLALEYIGPRKGPAHHTRIHQLAGYAGATLALLLLTAFNHVQGLGIAAFEIFAVLVWRLVARKPRMIIWVSGAAVVFSIAAVLWYPRHPLLDLNYRPGGWLSPWYGFNLLSPSSPAFARALAIVGAFGLLNIFSSLLLFRRNHVVGYLTIVPIIALCLPVVAIPFSSTLATRSAEEIVTFSRMLFSIPAGLGLVTLLGSRGKLPLREGLMQFIDGLPEGNRKGYQAVLVMSFILLSFYFVAMSPAQPFYNRLYNVLSVPPNDLAMHHVIDAAGQDKTGSKQGVTDATESFLAPRATKTPLVMPGMGYVLNSTGVTQIMGTRKWMTWGQTTPPSLTTSTMLETLPQVDSRHVHPLSFPATEVIFTPLSPSAYLSRHWFPVQVPVEHATQAELFSIHLGNADTRRPPQLWLEWNSPTIGSFTSIGTALPLESLQEDRGSINLQMGSRRITAGEKITLRPVLRTLDGNGAMLEIQITGPDSFVSERQFHQRANPLGGDKWFFGDHPIKFPKSGTYGIVVRGTVVWPRKTYTVKHTLTVE